MCKLAHFVLVQSSENEEVMIGRASGVKTAPNHYDYDGKNFRPSYRASNVGDMHEDCHTLVKKGRWLPYQVQIWLRKIARRRERREKKDDEKTNKITN